MFPPIELIDFLKNKDHFIIATHISPDGDGLGSSIALSMALEQIKKDVLLLCKDNVPIQYKFLPGQEKFITLENLKSSNIDITTFKHLILIDCNDIDRIIDKDTKENSISLSSLYAIVIDHHETEKSFGDIRWVMPDAAATGLMIYYIIKELKTIITPEIAINLYAALATDTGNFRYENTDSEVLNIAAELVKAGARPHLIYRELFESWSEGRFALFTKVLNTLKIEDKIAIVTVTKKMFEETGTNPEDTEYFVEFFKIIKNINVSVLFREIDSNYYKVSLRSKDDINVASVAASYGGGGHKNASGFRIRADIDTAKRDILNKLEKII